MRTYTSWRTRQKLFVGGLRSFRAFYPMMRRGNLDGCRIRTRIRINPMNRLSLLYSATVYTNFNALPGCVVYLAILRRWEILFCSTSQGTNGGREREPRKTLDKDATIESFHDVLFDLVYLRPVIKLYGVQIIVDCEPSTWTIGIITCHR